MADLHDSDYDKNPEVAHEDSDVNVRAILGFGVALAVLALAAQVFLWWLQGTYQRQTERAQTRAYPLAAAQKDERPPVQDNPQRDMRELRAKQEALLKDYAWVNRDAGIARIPVEDAMRIVVQRGLPVRERTK